MHDPVTWYKITHAGKQVAQWDFRNNETRTSPSGPAFFWKSTAQLAQVVITKLLPNYLPERKLIHIALNL